MKTMKVEKCPSDVLSLTNRIVLNPADLENGFRNSEYLRIMTGGQSFAFSTSSDKGIPVGSVGFSILQRKWAVLSINQDIDVSVYDTKHVISSMTLTVDYFKKKNTATEPFDSEAMASSFLSQFPKQVFTKGQSIAFQFGERPILSITVKEIEAIDLAFAVKSGGKKESSKDVITAICLPDSALVFERAEGSSINIIGKCKGGASTRQSIINPDWDFSKMGIGGLDDQFNAIFRRAFASRVFPPEIMEQLGCKHVKGILLYGPPGTGKTLLARQIGQMLNCREPKIVNGPQILDKYVGESEANIRRLFADAEEEEKRMGPNSGLHIIIFDEIDAICKARGSVAGNTGVNDTVVNQLLSKIDGVDQLNNILIIGMTNRRDMMDDALLRPGRLEVSIEIGLPKESGRLQILNIHTRKMIEYKKLEPDVDLVELASMTKNFSGAEIEGLVRAAQSCALNRLVKASSKVELDPEAAEKLKISRADFIHALEHDIKPAFGADDDVLQGFVMRGIINWGQPVQDVLDDGALLIQQANSSDGPGLVSILLEGAPNSGKSALAATLAIRSGFPFVRLCSPESMIGYTESAKCHRISKIFDDAYRSMKSCILVDNIERLLDYGAIGPRYSNLTLQALLVLLGKNPPKGRRLLVICTTSRKAVLEQMEMTFAFTDILHVSNCSQPEHVRNVLEVSGVFDEKEIASIIKHLQSDYNICIGVKKILDLLDMVKQMDPSKRVIKFLSKLEEEGFIYHS